MGADTSHLFALTDGAVAEIDEATMMDLAALREEMARNEGHWVDVLRPDLDPRSRLQGKGAQVIEGSGDGRQA